MTIRISPELRQHVPSPQVVSANVSLTHGDAFKIWTTTSTAAGIAFTLPQARAGDGPFYFSANTAQALNVTAQSADNLAGLGTGQTLTINPGVTWGVMCTQAGYWSPFFVSAEIIAPAIVVVPTTIGTTTVSLNVQGTSTQAQGYLGFTNITTSTNIGGIGGGALITGSGVNDLQFWSNNQNLQFAGGNGSARQLTLDSTGKVTIWQQNNPMLDCNEPNSTVRFPQYSCIGSAGGGYPLYGYNFVATTTPDSYKAAATDNTAAIRIGRVSGGGIEVLTGGAVTAGAAITYTCRMLINSVPAFGIFSVAAANSGAAQSTGWGTPTGNAKVANFPGATATLVQCSNVIAQIITDLKAWGFYGA